MTEFTDTIQSTGALKRDPNYNFLVYGPPGSGKTYMNRTLDEKTLVGSCESGLASLMDADIDFVQIDKVQDLRDMYKYLATADHDYQWAGVDSASELAEMCLSEMKARHKDGRKAYGEMAETVIKLMRAFRDLDMSVYFSAKQRRDTVDGQMVYIPSMPGSILTEKQPIGHKFDFVFPLVVSENDEGDVERYLLTEATADYQAKARDPKHALDKFEAPDLGSIRQKLIASYNDDE